MKERVKGKRMQGYLIIATGSKKYFDLAVNCALSIKAFDKCRKIQLLTDAPNDSEWLANCRSFDHITHIRVSEGFEGPASKLHMNKYSIFDETMFVDADCLLLRNPDYLWASLKGRVVAIPGNMRTSGAWYGTTIDKMMRAFGVPKIAQINSGVCYFEKSDKSDEFFNIARQLLEECDDLRFEHRNGPPDEPYIGAAFGKTGLSPTPISDAWMISTVRAVESFIVDFPLGYSFRKGEYRYSPTFAHFVGLEPKEDYSRLVKAIAKINHQ